MIEMGDVGWRIRVDVAARVRRRVGRRRRMDAIGSLVLDRLASMLWVRIVVLLIYGCREGLIKRWGYRGRGAVMEFGDGRH